jgi:hypothetical protein
VCKYRFNVQLVWTKRHKNWVSERIVFKKIVTVEDDFGMTKQEGGKEI